METANTRTDVAVVGGGMAGPTAACYLAGSGANVALFGGAPYLGGRAATRNIRTMPYGSRIGMRLPNAAHESRPWRICEIAPDFTLGSSGPFPCTVAPRTSKR